MPAPKNPTVEHLTLPNGLQVVLRHAPRLRRCAAALRVAAGSHDVPAAWPGLAHFLEHLFFLGTDQFPADDNLMAFVQRHGGQVNASTRERITDFFFELPQPAFAHGLERLCEMLNHPRMTLADQRREREVLHAEFIAWSHDAEARYQTTLLQPLSARHPLRAFHAGNRYSLPVPRQAFQQALQDFYRRFYHAGQMVLSLAGPQSLAELRGLATTYGSTFVSGEKHVQTSPPPLLDATPGPQSVTDPRRLHLIFACEHVPYPHPEALSFFQTWLTDEQPGGLVFELRKRGLIDRIKVEPLYQFHQQLLLNIEFSLTAEGSNQGGTIAGLFFDWLAFFKAHADDPKLHEEYALLQKQRTAVEGALETARRFCMRPDVLNMTLPPLLAALTREQLIHPQPVDNLSMQHIAWRLPAPNPFLRASLDDSSEGAVFLRWQLTSAHTTLWQMLNDSLHSLGKAAQQAGVSLAFSQYGVYWQLKLSGLSAPMPAIIEHALRLLTAPDAKTWGHFGDARNEPALIPIRQLLKRLPDHYLSACLSVDERDDNHDNELPTLWANARWTTFTVGLSEEVNAALNAELEKMPGTADDQPRKAIDVTPGKRWITDPSEDSESALLLFCPVPSHSVNDEAAWRLLAHLGQAPFYRRLRVELQLGYAVFSGLRQIAGQAGWLFGVQSPNASAEEIVSHLQEFVARLPGLIETADLSVQQHALAAQFGTTAMDLAQLSEWLWQAHLAGHDEHYPHQLQTALLQLKRSQLLDAAGQLNKATGGWIFLSNRPTSSLIDLTVGAAEGCDPSGNRSRPS